MKKTACLTLFLLINHWVSAQSSLTLDQLKTLKNQFQPEIIQVHDSAIVYPVTGMINIDIKSSLMGETIVEVEVWVVDSKGKLVYNNIFAAKDLSEKNFDQEYMRYMRMKGKKILKRRHVWLSQDGRKTTDS